MKRAILASFQEFRQIKMNLYEDKKISSDDLADATFGFVTKSHIKPTTKAQNKSQVLLNYYYWTTFVERKISMGEHLIKMELGTLDQLHQTVQTYLKRRDKLVEKLLSDLKEKPALINRISPTQFEVHLTTGEILYAGIEVITELKIDVKESRSPKFPNYCNKFILPF
jgi:hypothetical protein